ncbi:MAG TPA: HAD-IA family hydrolase [Steroidobacteraceae bacterium]|nr:HAD-IA family hydrolase [Steroidobacteraceae bacterium]
MTAVRVLSFDLDDTLWPVAPAIAAAEEALWNWLRAFHPQAAKAHSIESMRELRAQVAVRFPERSHDLTFLRKQALSEQFAAAGCDLALAERAFDVFHAARNRVQLFADVRPSLARLAASFPLFALSNGNADLQLCGVGDLFSGHLTARAVGAAKPDRRLFAALAARAGAMPAEVVHVGDDPIADVEGARRSGMQAVWINREARVWPAGLAPPAHTIRSLRELL